ncbi:MAG: hypothetical protein JXR76_30035 [Deltaproteobacteria bacterium]|nr:hypothetical protein [Deltaproteobacteria bacterium]
MCPIEKVVGVHDVYLRFTANSLDQLLNLDLFRFVSEKVK